MAKPIRPIRPTAVRQEPKAAPKTPRKPPMNKNSVFLIMLALPLFTVSTYVLYKRVILGQPKRVQQGEYTPDGGLRIFDAEEKKERNSNTWTTWFFGKEQ